MLPQNTGSIAKERVRYLSLEGGGGAGNGYAGAFKALQDLKILNYENSTFLLKSGDNGIKGISGASAGAITGTLLACGFPPYEIREIMESLDTESFFDVGEEGEIPVPGGFAVKQSPTVIKEPLLYDMLKKVVVAIKLGAAVNLAVLFAPVFTIALLVHGAEFALALIILVPKILQATKNLPPGLKKKLTSKTEVTAKGLYSEYGLFLGKTPRVVVNRLINLAKFRNLSQETKKSYDDHIKLVMWGREFTYEFARREIVQEYVTNKNSDYLSLTDDEIEAELRKNPAHDKRGTTFKEFKATFKVDLLLTGTNLETKKSHVFSAETTPDFYVEDAVRISMSLPMVFKPMFIKDGIAVKDPPTQLPNDDFMQGIWVDGGYFNNSPVNLFPPDQTIGLRLEQDDERSTINSFSEYLNTWPIGLGVFGSGEAHLSATMVKLKRFNTIVLNTRLDKNRVIGLFDFKPEPNILREVNLNTEIAVKKYFELNLLPIELK